MGREEGTNGGGSRRSLTLSTRSWVSNKIEPTSSKRHIESVHGFSLVPLAGVYFQFRVEVVEFMR
jgi:hypothetical protein